MSKKFLSDVLIECGLQVSGTTALGTATATTVATSDNSTNIATTAWVKSLGYSTTDSFVSDVSLSGSTLTFTGINSAFTGSIDLSTITSSFNTSDVTTVYERVKNVSGAPISKGTPLAVTAGQTSGNISDVIPADASDPAKMPAIFIANEDISEDAEGEAVLFGNITGIDTSLYQSGTTVYVAPGGGWTDTKPDGNNLIQNLGVITKQHPTNGGGIVTGVGRANAVPNIAQGYAWVGNANGVATPTQLGSAAYASTSDFAAANHNHDSAYVNVGGDTMTGNLVLNNGIELRSKDTTGTARTIARVTSNDELQYGWSAAGPVQFMGGGSYTERMRIHTNGNIGIGTSAPSHKVDIYSNENVPLRIHRPSNANLDSSGAWGIGFSTRSDANTSTTDTRAGIFSYYNGNLFLAAANTSIVSDPDAYARLTVLNTGYVGIGTTSPGYKLDVNGTANFGDKSINYAFVQVNGKAGWYTGLKLARGDGGYGSVGNNNYGLLVTDSGLEISTFSALGDNVTGRNARIQINNSGNVGIGTTNPTTKLEVNGSFKSTGIQDASNALTVFINGNNEVGIGTTSPTQKLDVNGAIRLSGQIANVVTNGIAHHTNGYMYFTGGTAGAAMGNDSYSSAIYAVDNGSLELYAGSANRLHITSGGNVGIGTTSPIYGALEVYRNGGNSTIAIHEDAGTAEARLHFRTGGNDTVFRNTSNKFIIDTEGAINAITFDTAGNVGIGTTSPSQKLHVKGNVRIEGSSTSVTLETTDKVADPTGAVYATYPTNSTYGAFVDYVIYDTGRDSMRVGTMRATWNANEVVYADVSTIDIGDTSVVTMTAVLNGTDVDLVVTGDSVFTVKLNVKVIR